MTMMKILVLLCAALLFSCSEHPAETEIAKVNESTVESQSAAPDSDAEISISPVNATVETIITLKTSLASIRSGDVRWYINGQEDMTTTGYRLVPTELRKGDSVKAVITDGEKEYHSNELEITNTPPEISRAFFMPSTPRVSDILKVDIQARDADNDYISYSYYWTVNGTFAGEGNYLDRELKRGDIITVEVTPHDGEDSGKSTTLTSQIFNSHPLLAENENTTTFEGNLYKYQVNATDPDGDSLVYSLEEGPEGMKIDPATGIITWEVTPEDAGIYEIKVSVSDNMGGKIMFPITTNIGFQVQELQSS